MPLTAHGSHPASLTYSADFSLKTAYHGKMLSNGINYSDRVDERSSQHLQHLAGEHSDESDSEEIDLTSNGCIDFSNNNNNNK